MNNITKNILGGIIIAFVLFLMWYFSTIVIYTLIAAVISIVGRPIVRFFDGVRFRRFKLPHVLSTFLSLIVIVGSIVILASVFVPLIIHQAKVIADIDVNAISADMRLRLKGVQDVLHQYGILRYYENLDTVLISKATRLNSS